MDEAVHSQHARNWHRARTTDGQEAQAFIVEHSDYGTATVYLDEDQVHSQHDRRRSEIQLHVAKDGQLLSATLRGRDLKATDHVGRSYGLNQKIRAYFACGTTIILDEAAVSTSVGDY